jgi:ELWxxDGT repeat protein
MELRRTDGTDILLVTDVNPGSDGSDPTGFKVIGDRMFFAARAEATGAELRVTDGVSVTLMADINPGPGGSNPGDVTLAPGDQVCFSATAPETGREFYCMPRLGSPSEAPAAGAADVEDTPAT